MIFRLDVSSTSAIYADENETKIESDPIFPRGLEQSLAYCSAFFDLRSAAQKGIKLKSFTSSATFRFPTTTVSDTRPADGA